MFKFDPAINRRHELQDSKLEGTDALVQAMRMVHERACFLLSVERHYTVICQQGSLGKLPKHISEHGAFILERSLFDTLIVNVRAVCDADTRSIGLAAIGKLLRREDPRAGLVDYLDGSDHRGKMIDKALREQCLDYIAKYSAILSAEGKAIPADTHSLVEKVALVRRVGHKRTAHLTLDDYKLWGSDLIDVIYAIVVVAAAVEAVMGDAASGNALAAVEASAVRSANALSVASEHKPWLINSVFTFLPGWLAFDREFPRITQFGVVDVPP